MATATPCPSTPTPSGKSRWRKVGRFVGVLVILILGFVIIPRIIKEVNDSSSSTPLSYTLCDGDEGPPGVKDFASLPRAESDPASCYPAEMKISVRGDEVTVRLSYDNSHARINASKGKLEGKSYDGRNFVAVFTANNEWAKPPTMRKATVVLTEEGGVFRGVYETHLPGQFSQIVLLPR